MPGMLPPVLLELRSSASQFIAENKAAGESLGGLGAAGDAAARRAEVASAQEASARSRLAAAVEVDSAKIRAAVDEQVAAEERLAREMGQAYDSEARKAQLTASAIKKSSQEQIAAQQAVRDAEAESKAAAAELAAANETNAAKSSGAWSRAMGKTKTVMGVAGAAVAVESLKMAADFQRQTSKLVTAAGESETAIGMVRTGIKHIAEDTGTSLEELNSGAYQIESAGYHGAAALKVLTAAAQGAAVEGADMKGVGNALTTVMNDVGASSNQASLYMSEMVTAVGQGKMTMDDLAGSIHSVLPNAAKLGLTFPQVAGALAEMTSQGMSADQSAQNLNHTIVKLAAPTIGMTKTMALYGLTSSDVAKKLGKTGLAGTMEELEQAIMQKMGPAGVTLVSAFNQSKTAAADMHEMYGKLPPSLQELIRGFQAGHVTLAVLTKSIKETGGQGAILGTQYLSLLKAQGGFNDLLKSGSPAAQTFTAAMKGMLGDQTGLQVALHLTGENMTGLKDRTKAIAGATADAHGNVRDWTITQKLLTIQLARAKQIVEVLAVDIGSKLIPIVSSVVGWFLKHKTVTLALAAVLGGAMVIAIGAYVAKLVWGAAETVGKLAVMVASWMGLGPAVATAATETELAAGEIAASSEAAGVATTTAFGPIGLAVAAIGIAVMLLATHWKQVWHGIVDVAKAVWNGGIKPVFDAMKDIWTATWQVIETAWNTVGQPVFDVVKSAVGILIDFWKLEFDILKGIWDVVWASVKLIADTVIAPVFRFIKDHWKLVLDVMLPGMGLIITNWKRIWGAVKAVYQTVIAPVFSAIGTVSRKVGDGVKWAWDHVMSPVFGWIKTGIHGVWTIVSHVVGAISSAFRAIGKGLQWAWDHSIGPVFTAIKNAVQWVQDALASLEGKDITGAIGGAGNILSGATGTLTGGTSAQQGVSGTLPGHAGGGDVDDGWFTVGERGTELGYKQGNSVRIFSNGDSGKMLAQSGNGGGGTQVLEATLVVNLDGKVIQTSVEKHQLRAGMRRGGGNTYQPYNRGRS